MYYDSMNIIHHNQPVQSGERAVLIRDFAGIKSGTVLGIVDIKGEVAETVAVHGFGESTPIPLAWLVWVP
jgi:hypothetical protein